MGKYVYRLRSKRWRRSSHPLTMKIDAVTDAYETNGWDVSVGDVSETVANSAGGKLILSTFENLVAPAVRRRLKQRGYVIVDRMTMERKRVDEVTTSEFREGHEVKVFQHDAAGRWIKAEAKIIKLLERQEQKLGRPVTVGEFEQEVGAIYQAHGL